MSIEINETTPFDQLLTSLAECEHVPGKLAASIVRFAHHVARQPTPDPSQTVTSESADAKPRRRRAMSPEQRQRMSEGRKRYLEKRRAGSADTFQGTPPTNGDAMETIAVSEHGGGRGATDVADDRSDGAGPGETL